MAGESPDRSKQRESSVEPTSGSTGPVPEARTEERTARDPRLAVARDAEASGGSASGESGEAGEARARGGVDTATRVFSVRDVKTEAEGQAAASPSDGGPSGDSGDSADSVDSGDSADSGKDAASSGDVSSGDASAGPDETDEPAGGAAAVAAADGDAGGTPGDDRLRAAVAAWVRSGDSQDPESATGRETASEAAGAG